MSKVRRGEYGLLASKGDHGPRHVHVYRSGRLVVKWDLERGKAMKGRPTRRILELIEKLLLEGCL
jgi:hypothetical protein